MALSAAVSLAEGGDRLGVAASSSADWSMWRFPTSPVLTPGFCCPRSSFPDPRMDLQGPLVDSSPVP